VPSLHRSGMLAAICAQAKSIAVAGTHGKTSTTSMLMLMLAEAGWRPSFVIGGDVTDMGTGAQWTGGEWLVVEADESDGTHLALPLHGTILTNVDVDHLDHYGTFDAIVDGFDHYLAQVPGPKVLCLDDAVCAHLATRHDAVTYGTSPDADFAATDVVAEGGSFRFTVLHRGAALGDVSLPLRGLHNVRNATGALAMAVTIGVPFAVAAAALAKFGGVARRFDIRAVDGGATLVDDYAHLPSEIAAVLAAARASGDGWQRVVAVFQPNRYNRMAVMSPDYADAFGDADLVVLTDIYASGTTPIPGVTGRLIVDAVQDAHPDAHVVWLPRRDDLISFLAGEVGAGDVCISMGCGDVAALPDEVLARRAERRLG
jgi:UDP-N-acetylmuramate--alanine ligase